MKKCVNFVEIYGILHEFFIKWDLMYSICAFYTEDLCRNWKQP